MNAILMVADAAVLGEIIVLQYTCQQYKQTKHWTALNVNWRGLIFIITYTAYIYLPWETTCSRSDELFVFCG